MLMSRLVLTAVNARFSQTNLALFYLNEALRRDDRPENKHILLEWDINRSKEELLEALFKTGGTHFFFSAYIWNAAYLKTLIPDLIRLMPGAVICAGGPEAVWNPLDWLELPGLSYILDGSAEDFAVEAGTLPQPEKPRILKKAGGSINSAPFPYTAAMLDELKGRIIYYEASRGCAFNCSYCLSAAGGTGVEHRSRDSIIKEIELLSRFEGTVKFVDRTFNSNTEISRLIWQLMAENPPAGCFHFELHPMLLQEDDFRLIESLPEGSAQFEIGIQSTDSEVLRNVNRPDKPAESFENIKRLISIKKHHIHLDQIIGLPGDTPEKAAASLDDIMALKPDAFQPGFLKLLPGAPLYNDAASFGIKASNEAPYEVLETSSLNFTELRKFKRIARLVEIIYNSGFFRHSAEYTAGKIGGWHRLFTGLLEDRESPNLNCRQWKYWGERLYTLGSKTEGVNTAFLTDLLRLDWCPFSSSQYYPDFITYSSPKQVSKLKSLAVTELKKRYPELRTHELRRAILFIPESDCGFPAESMKFFIRTDDKLKVFTDFRFFNCYPNSKSL